MDPWHLVDIRGSRQIMLPQILWFSVSHAKISKWMAVWKGAWSLWCATSGLVIPLAHPASTSQGFLSYLHH